MTADQARKLLQSTKVEDPVLQAVITLVLELDEARRLETASLVALVRP